MEGRSGSVKTFVKAQTMHTVNSKWTSEEKDLFLKFHYRSPSFYKFLLKEGFTLPSPSTIVRWYNTIEFSTGISIKILQMLNEKFKDTPELEKRCVLVFDEMSIKTELEYNTKEDCVYGFSDLGELGRERSFSEYALLFMLRGLNKPWKQVIGYYCGSVRGIQLSEILKSTLNILITNQINVYAVICDQGSPNRTAYKQLGVSISQPYVTIQNKKIFCLYDVVHLFKSFRNNLLKSNVLIGEVS